MADIAAHVERCILGNDRGPQCPIHPRPTGTAMTDTSDEFPVRQVVIAHEPHWRLVTAVLESAGLVLADLTPVLDAHGQGDDLPTYVIQPIGSAQRPTSEEP